MQTETANKKRFCPHRIIGKHTRKIIVPLQMLARWFRKKKIIKIKIKTKNKYEFTQISRKNKADIFGRGKTLEIALGV
jgi:hypothetical protein